MLGTVIDPEFAHLYQKADPGRGDIPSNTEGAEAIANILGSKNGKAD